MAGFSDLLPEQNPSVIYEDIEKIPGSSWHHGWTILDGDNAPVDFTGGVARMQIRDFDGSVVGSWTEATSSRQILLEEGSVTITSTPAGTESMFTFSNDERVKTYEYNLEVTVSGQTVHLASGTFIVHRGIVS